MWPRGKRYTLIRFKFQQPLTHLFPSGFIKFNLITILDRVGFWDVKSWFDLFLVF